MHSRQRVSPTLARFDFARWVAFLLLILLLGAGSFFGSRENSTATTRLIWNELPYFSMSGGLKVFWDVGDGSGRGNGENWEEAIAHGFSPITQSNIYVDYQGDQKENIYHHLGKKPINPWDRPTYFERTIRRNIEMLGSAGVHVHDIEFNFERDVGKAWQNNTVRAASGIEDRNQFENAYFSEWASWYTLPLVWAKQRYPSATVGLYGIQPFARDYWGVAYKTEQQIDKVHEQDHRIWKFIDPYVDFYVADIYVYSLNPHFLADSPKWFYFMAVNVEENYLRSRKYGSKPVYAYEWLRFHDLSPRTGDHEHSSDMVEAMAILPFFSGAKGIVLWGYEPQLKPGEGRPYQQLPLFMKSLARVSLLSEKIGKAQLVIDQPASLLWKQEQPLVRRLIVTNSECIIMALNPWQGADEQSEAQVKCGDKSYAVTMRGRHTTIAYIDDRGLMEY
jgi:hypothetical protein